MALGVFLMAMPGVLPVIVGAIGSMMDSDHRVAIAQAGDETSVLLKHDRPCGASHMHHAVSRFLVFFADPAAASPDHVLHFASGGKFLREAAIVLPPLGSSPLPPATTFTVEFATGERPLPPSPASSPPAPPGALSGVRTTLLLI